MLIACIRYVRVYDVYYTRLVRISRMRRTCQEEKGNMSDYCVASSRYIGVPSAFSTVKFFPFISLCVHLQPLAEFVGDEEYSKRFASY